MNSMIIASIYALNYNKMQFIHREKNYKKLKIIVILQSPYSLSFDKFIHKSYQSK